MKSVFLVILCAFFMGTSLIAQQGSESVEKVDYKATSQSIVEILYVLKVPKNLENIEQINKLKGMKSHDVEIMEKNNELLLLYKGAQFTSDVEPDFIKEINVYKGDKAKANYPSAPAGGVIEMKVEDVDALVTIFHAIKAS